MPYRNSVSRTALAKRRRLTFVANGGTRALFAGIAPSFSAETPLVLFPERVATQARRMKVAIVLVVLTAPLLVYGQDRKADHNAHGWYSYAGDHPIRNTKWGLHLEGQYRRHDVIQKWQQLMLRPAVNYQLSSSLTLTAGYGFIRTHTYGDFTSPSAAFPEHRLWEQAWWRYKGRGLNWGTRVRFENRFIGSPSGANYRYENRLRLFQQTTKPLTSKSYLTASNELKFYVKPYVSSSTFDQNRAYGAVGLNLSPSLRMEVGYLNQLLLRRSGSVIESNHTLILTLFSNARILGE